MNYYYQVCLTLIIFSFSVNAKFRYEQFKTFSYRDDNDDLRSPWFIDDYRDSYETSASDVATKYNNFPKTISVRSNKFFPGILVAESTKRIPKEDKYAKKAISPFFSINDKNDKLKRISSETIPVHCKEIRSEISKASSRRSEKDDMTCYKCKDPKSGYVYEQCSYSSKPQATSKIEHFVPAPTGFRYRRSHVDNSKVRSLGTSLKFLEVDGHGKPKDPYRFGDEFFTDATQEVPSEYKKETENCEKVVKDSMVCLVCKDAKTNGKYEQCSYVTQPKEKAFAYTKSSSFGKTDPRKSSPEKYQSYKTSGPSESESEDHGSSYPERNVRYGDEKIEEISSEGTNNCKKIEKNGQTCTVCKDPKNGGESEKCSYSHQPNDKSYSYTRSGSFGQPKNGGSEKIVDRSSQPYRSSFAKNTGDYDAPGERSDGEKETSATSADCKKVEKDGETCMVCKDSKTGDNYERCSYAYQPNDKVYKFSKSKSFGYPQTFGSSKNQDDEGKNAEGESSGPQESAEYKSDYSYPEDSSYYRPSEYKGSPNSRDYPTGSSSYRDGSKDFEYETSPSADYKSISEKATENIDAGNCKEVQRDGMVCTVCKDPKTGGNSEKCAYSFEPKDKVFSYTKARSFGSPTDAKDDSSKESSETPGDSYDAPYKNANSYGYVSESKPQATINHLKSADGRSKETVITPDKVDKGFFDTSKKKEEIEKFLQEFQKEDRSKCKKVMRDKMTCYQCTDEGGFQKEECVFVAAQEPSKDQDRLAYREVKHYQLPETVVQTASATAPKKQRPKRRRAESLPLEPTAAASEDSYSREKSAESPEEDEPIQEKAEQTEKEEREEREEEKKEAEPYDYVLETRPKYDKVLGMTLPEYMLTPSEHEIAFDEAVASGFQY